ncbi:MAG TPA: LuxR C-terminal-related transcriptional regulator [Candidatus Acidoferrum sp.]
MALKLNISERTVKFHLENIFGKLEVHDRHAAIRILGSSRISELLGLENSMIRRDSVGEQRGGSGCIGRRRSNFGAGRKVV